MARLSIEIPDEKHNRFKKKTLINDTNMSKIVEPAIDKYLAEGEDDIAVPAQQENKLRELTEYLNKFDMEWLKTSEEANRFQSVLNHHSARGGDRWKKLRGIEMFGRPIEEIRKSQRKPLKSSQIYLDRAKVKYEHVVKEEALTDEQEEIVQENEEIITE